MGLFLSVMYSASQVEGVHKVRWFIEGKPRDYLPEGTGIKGDVPIPLWENDYDPGPEKDKFTAYLILRNSDYIVPAAISARSPEALYSKLADSKTYGGVFERSAAEINFKIQPVKGGKLRLALDNSLLNVKKERQSALVRSLACTVYNYVESRTEFDRMSVSYDGSEVVSLFDVDVTAEGCAEWLEYINLEEEK